MKSKLSALAAAQVVKPSPDALRMRAEWRAAVAVHFRDLENFKKIQNEQQRYQALADSTLDAARQLLPKPSTDNPEELLRQADIVLKARADKFTPFGSPGIAGAYRSYLELARGMTESVDRAAATAEKSRSELDRIEKEMEHSVPLVTSTKLTSQMEHVEESVKMSAQGAVVRGTEYLGAITASGLLGSGAVAFTSPVNPRLLGGGRVGVIASTFELYKPKSIIFEYIPYCAATSAGAFVGFAEPDIMNNNALTPGASLSRDALARPGAQANQVWERCAYGMSFDQQQWYYCSNTESPNLTIAALFTLVALSTLAAGTLGAIVMHYEFEFQQATTFTAANNVVRTLADTVATFTGLTETINQAFFVVSASFLTMSPGEIGVGVIKAFADAGAPTSWRTLLFGENRVSIVIGVGTRLFFRRDPSGANINFYPSFGAATLGINAATDPGQAAEVVVNSATNVIAGASTLTFEQIQIWQLPADA